MSAHSPEVQALLDRQAILDCLHRYTRGLDRHDEELIASAFHEDAVDNHGAFIGTPQEFFAWQKELHQEWTAHTHFLDCNHIDIDGDVAHSECYVLFFHRRPDHGVDQGGGRYIDRLERRNGQWKIAARQLLIEWYCQADGTPFADVLDYPRGTWDRSDVSYRRPFELQARSEPVT